jgi:hypothetical protein
MAPRIAFRRIARATDTRTSIASLVPPHVVLTDVAPYLLRVSADEQDEAFVLGVLSSIPFDWGARRIVESHLDFHVLDGFTFPNLDRSSRIRREVQRISARLAAVDGRYANWADHNNVEVGPVDRNEGRELEARLDAAVSHAYGLDSDDIRVMFETFHVGWDFTSRLAAVLDHVEELV